MYTSLGGGSSPPLLRPLNQKSSQAGTRPAVRLAHSSAEGSAGRVHSRVASVQEPRTQRAWYSSSVRIFQPLTKRAFGAALRPSGTRFCQRALMHTLPSHHLRMTLRMPATCGHRRSVRYILSRKNIKPQASRLCPRLLACTPRQAPSACWQCQKQLPSGGRYDTSEGSEAASHACMPRPSTRQPAFLLKVSR